MAKLFVEEISKEGSTETISIPQSKFAEMAELSFDHIVKAKPIKFSEEEKAKAKVEGTELKKEEYSFPDIEAFMQEVQLQRIKAFSREKNDITLVVHDFHINHDATLGFSIKSKLGGKSTLFNANEDGTNFIFGIKGHLSEEEIVSFNELRLFKDKFVFLKEKQCKVSSLGHVVDRTFRNNIRYIDRDLLIILPLMSLIFYSTDKKNLSDVCAEIERINPCCLDSTMDFYQHKIKQFLIASALGMTANTAWNGIYQANGGYIVVKKDGNLVCFHFYERNQLEDYLFYNTALETPSTSRHKFGKIIKDPETGRLYLKLNLQIRFIHNN